MVLRTTAIAFIGTVYCHLYPVTDFGPDWINDSYVLVIVLIFFLVVAGLVGIVMSLVHLGIVLFSREKRRTFHFVHAGAWLMPALSTFSLIMGLRHVWDGAVFWTTSRVDPVMSAIQAFERDQGEPPPSLQALIPAYLESIPAAPSRGKPEFQYFPNRNAKSSKKQPRWELRMAFQGEYGPANMIYWPNDEYDSPRLEGVKFFIINDWAVEQQD